MKQSQGLKGTSNQPTALDRLESRITGKPLRDPRREKYSPAARGVVWQASFFPGITQKENK